MGPRREDQGVPDLVAELRASITAARLRREQRERDNLPCPTCGGDRLRSDFTGSGRCHAPKTDIRPTSERESK